MSRPRLCSRVNKETSVFSRIGKFSGYNQYMNLCGPSHCVSPLYSLNTHPLDPLLIVLLSNQTVCLLIPKCFPPFVPSPRYSCPPPSLLTFLLSLTFYPFRLSFPSFSPSPPHPSSHVSHSSLPAPATMELS